MGWSCTKKVADTLNAWTALCRESTGSQNTFKTKNGRTYFFDTDPEEFDEGGAKGGIFAASEPTLKGSFHCFRVGSFSIASDGYPTISQDTPAPAADFLEAVLGLKTKEVKL
jgi:hypothetical protein